MATAMETFTKKQAGVIYCAVKEGKIEMGRKMVGDMYDLAHEGFRPDWNGAANSAIQSYHLAIDAIFAGDYETAQEQIDRLAA